jgi:hypothetical protein
MPFDPFYISAYTRKQVTEGNVPTENYTDIWSDERGQILFGENHTELQVPNGWQIWIGSAGRGYTHDHDLYQHSPYVEVVVRNKRLGIERYLTDKYDNSQGYIGITDLIALLATLASGTDEETLAFITGYTPRKQP